MKITKYTFYLLVFFVLMFIYWVGIQVSHVKDSPINLLYSFATAVEAFIGGLIGLIVSRHWGGRKSAVGKAILLISSGTISWSLGNFAWSFYNFVLHQDVPYPSFADLGYSLAVPLWAIGVFYLSQATGAKFSLGKVKGRVILVVLPILAAIFSYYFLVTIARNSVISSGGGNMLKLFLDFYYPLGDWVILTVSLLLFGLSLKYLGGKFKWPVYIILLGFVTMFLADFSFSYTTTVNTYYNGSFPDLLFAAAMFIISFGVDSLDVS